MTRELDTLFRQYETAFNDLDLKTISGFYADTFISAGPKGSIAANQQDLSKRAEGSASFYRSIGLNSARIISKRVMPICDEYSMVVVRWGLTFEKTGTKPIEFDITYIVQERATDPRIILFISHEDEEVVMKKFGLIPKIASE